MEAEHDARLQDVLKVHSSADCAFPTEEAKNAALQIVSHKQKNKENVLNMEEGSFALCRTVLVWLRSEDGVVVMEDFVAVMSTVAVKKNSQIN